MSLLMFRRMISTTRPVLEKQTLFVGNLAWATKESDLGSLFGQFGKVDSVRIITDRDSGRSKGFGFIEMEDVDAVIAIEKLNGHDLLGRDLKVNASEPRPDRPPREGGFNRGPREGGFNRAPREGGFNRGPRDGGYNRSGNSDRY
ncbi:RNP-1 like RNA-binding protein [Chytriomyces sp. MP71]|nr:RNP-1 like RNA-binding protein [Chytriomyces sp. MP71]